MKDDVFGQMEWDEVEERWITAVSLPWIRGFGELLRDAANNGIEPSAPLDLRGLDLMEAGQLIFGKDFPRIYERAAPGAKEHLVQSILRLTDAKHPPSSGTLRVPCDEEVQCQDPLDPDVLLRKGHIRLSVATGIGRRRPTDAQRAAWQRVCAAGRSLCDRIVNEIFVAYRRQHAVRTRWFAEIFGKDRLGEFLPDVKNIRAMKKLIRPYQVCVLPAVGRDTLAKVGIQFAAPWADGLGVVISDESRVTVGPAAQAVVPVRVLAELEHPKLGGLRRLERADRPWEGTTRCDLLRDFFDCAYRRAEFSHGKREPRDLDPRLPWDFADGRFDLLIHTAAGAAPTDAQTAVLDGFRSDERRHSMEVLTAILQHYRTHVTQYRKAYSGLYAKHVLPTTTNVDGLTILIRLTAINVFPQTRGGQVSLGFEFSCAWGRELGLRWCSGSVQEVGAISISRPSPVRAR